MKRSIQAKEGTNSQPAATPDIGEERGPRARHAYSAIFTLGFQEGYRIGWLAEGKEGSEQVVVPAATESRVRFTIRRRGEFAGDHRLIKRRLFVEL